MENKVCFRRFGTMIDCSRNAVMTVESLKKWIDITSDLGYNTLLLYTEDTYEVDDNPYFGYMRGRYTQDELKEIDRYALSKGMELIPCIQTLAHLNAIVRWPAYGPLIDTADILLAGEEKVYELVDKMFASISKCYTSRIINIGMDEAYLIGRGKYYDKHGDANRFDILLDHLNKVAEIGKKYGFQLTMWSDMFFRLAGGSGASGYDNAGEIQETVAKKIPDNVQLVYWCYTSTDKKHYDNILGTHKKIKEGTWFAGGLRSWYGFTPQNGFSMKTTTAALKSCRENGVQDVILTMWGDDGAECSKFALLPSLFYASELAKGNTKKAEIKAKFKEKYGITYDRFMNLDLPYSSKGAAEPYNSEKYLFYNDCFTGLLDSTLAGDENEKYAKCAKSLRLLKKQSEWGYLFETQHALSDVLAIKAELGRRTREVYRSRDKEALILLIKDYKQLQRKLDIFYKAFRKQWFTENKPHGFDVQDIRLGGLMCRIKNCTDRLQQLYDGKIDVIEELEEEQLDFAGNYENMEGKPIRANLWKNIVTSNVI